MAINNNTLVIGVLGGMGTFATINVFQQYAEVFWAEKEWERPRIIIDNRCTMPSRVRAFLYEEQMNELIEQMGESLNGLVNLGCNKIILACNTSHIFLPKVFEKNPDLKTKIIDIIQCCVEKIKKDGRNEVFLLGSEGTIEAGLYQKYLSDSHIKCIVPSEEEYKLLRMCIEAVKQNRYDAEIKDIFLNLINRCDSCILGCTELPILYKKYKKYVNCPNVYDPVLITLRTLKEKCFINN